jgi:hypothetical protein
LQTFVISECNPPTGLCPATQNFGCPNTLTCPPPTVLSCPTLICPTIHPIKCVPPTRHIILCPPHTKFTVTCTPVGFPWRPPVVNPPWWM